MTFRYVAFISYSRRDLGAATRLHTDLERFKLPSRISCDPAIPDRSRRLRPVFRDQTDLSFQNEEFWGQLEAELARSRYLILLCSPACAASGNVDREVRAFMRSRERPLDSLLPIVLAVRIDTASQTDNCLPPSLTPFRQQLASRNVPLTQGPRRTDLLLQVASWILR